MSKPWKGLLAALTSFVCFAADLTPHRPGSLSLKCQPFLRPNPPPMGVAGGGGGGVKRSFLSWINTQGLLHLTVEKVHPASRVSPNVWIGQSCFLPSIIIIIIIIIIE